MAINFSFLGKPISGPFTVPSGIVTTQPSIIQRIAEDIPEIGVITTKSIGPVPRSGNREPIYSQYAPGAFVNAVGLTNPGMEQAAKGLAQLKLPNDRFLLVSIFGGSVDEFVAVARLLAPYADGLELNLSCPHAKGYGMAMGHDPVLVAEIVSAVKNAASIPVVPKLTPNTDRIEEIATAAAEAGADAICAINTVGPGAHTAHGHDVLSNGVGGLSGKGVLAVAQKCIRDIRAVTDLPVIGCGGVSSKEDVTAMRSAGAEIIGVGSALTGMTTEEMRAYFADLSATAKPAQRDLAEARVQYDLDMTFKPVTLVKTETVCDDIALMHFKERIEIQAGEFVFLWIPGVGENLFPFCLMIRSPWLLSMSGSSHTRFRHYRQAQRLISAAPMGNPFTSNLARFPSWSPEARASLRFTKLLVTLTMRSFLSVQEPRSACIFWTSAERWRKSMWQPTMAAKVIPGGSPSALKPTWLTHQRTGFKPCDSITAARNPWCMQR